MMDLAKLRVKIISELDIETLRNMALLLTKCLGRDGSGDGYCVINDHNTELYMYSGSRENCIAFIEGYDSAPQTDSGCFDVSVNCVCVDTQSKTIVIPEDRFGEHLCGN